MIEAYLRRLDNLLSTSALVHDIEIVRRSIRDTEFEKVLHYRYRVLLANGDMVEMTERVLEAQGHSRSASTAIIGRIAKAYSSRGGIMLPTTGPSRPFRTTSMTGQRTMSCVIPRPRVLRCSSKSSRKLRHESRVGGRSPGRNKRLESSGGGPNTK